MRNTTRIQLLQRDQSDTETRELREETTDFDNTPTTNATWTSPHSPVALVCLFTASSHSSAAPGLELITTEKKNNEEERHSRRGGRTARKLYRLCAALASGREKGPGSCTGYVRPPSNRSFVSSIFRFFRSFYGMLSQLLPVPFYRT